MITRIGSRQPAPDAAAGGDLLERDAEISEIAAVLSAARDGITGVAVIEGAPGTGKSRLLETAAALARASGMRVLAARGLEFERELDFGVAVSLLEPALDGLPPEVRASVFHGGAADAAPLFGTIWDVADVDHPRLGRALARALRQLMRLLADGGGGYQPVLITVDDLRWCDFATLRFLTQLCAGPDTLPLAIVVAIRSEAVKSAGEALTAMLRAAPAARALRLSALSVAGVERLVRKSFAAAEPAFAAAFSSLTGGNPFYARELIDEAAACGLAPTAGSAAAVARLLPAAVARSVLSLVTPLPPPAAAIASAVAVLGDGVPLRRAAALAGADTASAASAADALAAVGVLRPAEPLAFDCSLTRAAVYAELAPFARSRAHLAASKLLDAEGVACDDVAAHLLRSGPEGDPRAVEVLRLAASAAAGRGAHAVGRLLLLRALDEPPPRSVWPAVVQELAVADARAGAPEAVTRVRAALRVADPERRVDLLRALARLLVARSEFAAAAEAAGQALAGLPAGLPAPDTRATQIALEALAIAGIAAVPPPAAAAALRDSIVAGAAAGTLPSDPGCLAHLAAVRLVSGAPVSSVAAAARAALDRMPLDDGFYGMLTGPAAISLISIDDYEPVRERASAMLSAASTDGVVITEGLASHWLSLARYREGDLTGAIEAGQRVLAVADAGWDVCAGLTAPILAHAYLQLGDSLAAARVLPPPDRFAAHRPDPWVIRAARAHLSMAAGEPRAALAELLDVGAHAVRGGFEIMLVEPWRAAAALAAAAAGDSSRARSLAGTEVGLARAAGAPRRLGIALRVAGAVHDGADRVSLTCEAVSVLEGSPNRLELARALIDLGALLRRRGEQATSRDPLRRGLDLARALAVTPLAERAEHELRAAGGRRRGPRARSGPAALTPAERSVASLAAGGMSTPRIAVQLSITAKTVDWHLGNSYRKLGISSRRDLPSALGTSARGPDSP